MKTFALNENDIQISSVRFCHDGNEVRFESYPRRIVYRGREYVLA
ncbi:MAG TPA: hypothetical protein VHA37_09280 [Candidatus Saccharimonadales bacterium]|nr:hypothetical protein [Candidatus Saccharimonadales bacterium]